MELIRITASEGGRQVVSARELYAFLEIKTDFSTWCERMFEYGFTPKEDFVLLPNFGEQNGSGGHNKSDWAFTVEMAKEISMIQRSEKGKQARLYFIECEKKLLAIAAPEPDELVLAKSLQIAGQIIERYRNQITELAPKAEYADKVLLAATEKTSTEMAKSLGLRSAAKLHELLAYKKIMFSRNGNWLLYANYSDKGYTKTRVFPYVDALGTTRTKDTTVWTEAGRKFLHEVCGVPLQHDVEPLAAQQSDSILQNEPMKLF